MTHPAPGQRSTEDLMPQWIHDRAAHIRAKNPGMPEGQSWAIATQQAHAAGKSPKGYGTPEGRRKAKQKYDAPKSQYEKSADPGSKGKTSGIDLALLKGFSTEFRKIAESAVRKSNKRMPPAEQPTNSENLPPPLATMAGAT